jgi:glycosyltransferase involved in cell wall biosynthesis
VDWREQCAVVIPCLNEAAAIGTVINQVRKCLPTVIVVDDGSSDGTGHLATECGASVLRHDSPRGKGAALKTGLGWASSRNFSWALTMDGDGQHLAADIPALLNRAEITNAALVVGNRMMNPVPMPWVRRQVNRWMSKRLSVLSGQLLPDSQCGLRLIALQAWSSLNLQTEHFEIESELLLAFLSARQRIEFVPIQVVYKQESSKIRPVVDAWRWLRWWWRTRQFAQTQSASFVQGGRRFALPQPERVGMSEPARQIPTAQNHPDVPK